MRPLNTLPLLPQPRKIRPEDGFFRVPTPAGLHLIGDSNRLAGLAPRLEHALHDNREPVWRITEANPFPAPRRPMTVRVDPTTGLSPESYRLVITPATLQIEAADGAGAFYGIMTLKQLLRHSRHTLPCGLIEDSPDIPVRGVMLDISRDKVPTLQTLFGLVESLAEWKINHLQLYMEHTFAYSGHRDVWAHASPFTAAEVRTLEAYCRDRFIELAANQNSFGHFERWLKHAPYRDLAECPDGFTLPSGEWRREPGTLDPANPKTRALLDELYGELLPNFTSRRIHVGCDEAWELGQGRSLEQTRRIGLPGVFLNHLRNVKELAAKHGRTALYWGDMVWNHFPGRLAELDPGMIHVDWGYYRDYPFRAHGEKLAAAGRPFWFAPGTATWNTLVGCNEAAFGSNRSAALAAKACGAGGILNTDWGDGGHWQYLPISFIGFAAGAAMAWCEPANPDEAIRAALDPHVFHDHAKVMGKTALALADTWQHVGENVTQSNLLDRLVRDGFKHKLPDRITEKTLLATVAHMREALSELDEVQLERPDGDWVVREFINNARLALHACQLGLAIRRRDTGKARHHQLAMDLVAIMSEHRRLWLARNREGGLKDSLRVMEEKLHDYRRGS